MTTRAMVTMQVIVAMGVIAAAQGDVRAKEHPVKITIGSKKFTESVILGEITAQLLRDAGASPTHRRELGGTRVLWGALRNGEIDIYPEYTGTITQEIFSERKLPDENAIRAALAEYDIRMTRSLGFNNTYAIGMKKSVADRLDIRTISDLRSHPGLRLGFGNEFMDRGDGWPSLSRAYRLPQKRVRGLDHDLGYRALDNEAIDVMDCYATDAEIAYYDLFVLTDDLHHFPAYDAVLLYRVDLARRAPTAVKAIARLEGRISQHAMIEMNAKAKIDKNPERDVARRFLHDTLGVDSALVEDTLMTRLGRTTREHLYLVSISMAAAILLAVPLGIIAAKQMRCGQIILGVVGVIQTIPALALLVLLMTLLRPLKHFGVSSIGRDPAIVALFLYSLLPIVRNTFTGLRSISPPILESAEALGLSRSARLWRIELPLASRFILAGIKTAAVINVGFATLGALIGAGGYGQPILTGIRLDNVSLILEGALPAALLALVVQGVFELLERWVVPKGLRMKQTA